MTGFATLGHRVFFEGRLLAVPRATTMSDAARSRRVRTAAVEQRTKRSRKMSTVLSFRDARGTETRVASLERRDIGENHRRSLLQMLAAP
jgi:hypothetical protein